MDARNKIIRTTYLTVTWSLVPISLYARNISATVQSALELVGIMVLFLLVITVFFKFLAYDMKRKQAASLHKKNTINPRQRIGTITKNHTARANKK